jgi:hypothetical protein
LIEFRVARTSAGWYLAGMSTVEEIEQVVEQLAPDDFDRLVSWINRRYHEQWIRQLDQDAATGKLDFLFEEAEAERQSGQLRDWPPANA